MRSVESMVLFGTGAVRVRVCADAREDNAPLRIVGLRGEVEAHEVRVRVASAVRAVGVDPNGRDVRVEWGEDGRMGRIEHCMGALDLASAAAILAACDSLRTPEQSAFFGGLGLDGHAVPVRGAVPAALAARRAGLALVTDRFSAAEVERAGLPARFVRGVEDLVSGALDDNAPDPRPTMGPDPKLSLDDYAASVELRRAVTVAAAGGHGLLLVGPPGCGKTMLARRIAQLLPELPYSGSLEVACAYSAAGLSIPRHLPFRAPHHTCSRAGLVGGGSIVRPGEVNLAHGGVLFLDELPEFSRSSLGDLEVALADGCSSTWRYGQRCTMPARPALLVATANPCPCGWRGSGLHQCSCHPERAHAYVDRMMPFASRHVPVAVRIDRVGALAAGGWGEATSRAARARARIAQLGGDDGLPIIGKVPEVDHHTMRVALTAAVLDGAGAVEARHVEEAMFLNPARVLWIGGAL